MTSYMIHNKDISSTLATSITKEEYQKLKYAYNTQLYALEIEKRYDLIIKNFIEFESSIFDASIRNIFYFEDNLDEQKQRSNQVIINLFSMCASYLDHTPKCLSFMTESNQLKQNHLKKLFELATNNAYDSFLGYQSLYHLRNHILHFGSPVHGYSRGFQWDDELEFNNHYVVPLLSVKEINKDNKLLQNGNKRSTIIELEKLANKKGYVDLRPVIRNGISGFSSLHKETRNIIKELVTDADLLIKQAIDKIESLLSNKFNVPYEITKTEKEEIIDKFLLHDGMQQKRLLMERKNPPVTNVEAQIVSTRINQKYEGK